MSRPIRRDGWTIAGVAIVAVAAIVASFTAQAGLGVLAGWDATVRLFGVELSLSWLLPLCVDAYGATATRIAVNSSRYSQETRRHALIHAIGAVVVSVVANAMYHSLEAGVLDLGTARWVLVVAVSMVPPVALGALAHLMALCARDDAEARAVPVESVTEYVPEAAPLPPAAPAGPVVEVPPVKAVPAAPEPVADVPEPVLVDDPLYPEAVKVFFSDVASGEVPGIRAIKTTLGVGQERAVSLQSYLRHLVEA